MPMSVCISTIPPVEPVKSIPRWMPTTGGSRHARPPSRATLTGSSIIINGRDWFHWQSHPQAGDGGQNRGRDRILSAQHRNDRQALQRGGPFALGDRKPPPLAP